MIPTTATNEKWVFVSHPDGDFDPNVNVKLVREPNPVEQALEDNQLLVETHAFSVDAFVRTMLDKDSFHGTMQPGSTIQALGYGKIVAAGSSAGKKFKVGTMVQGMLAVATYAVVTMNEQSFLQPKMTTLPGTTPSMSLGLLGVSGLTAYVGMFEASARGPQKGDTVLVSAAAGAVGCVAAKLAKVQGARVIGIAGGTKKQTFLTDTLGLDGGIDYKDKNRTVAQQLDQVCPEGIDFYFDNVGGSILDDVLERINTGARIVICGAISQYSKGQVNNKNVHGPRHYIKLAERNATMTGFTLMHYPMTTMARALVYLLYCHYRSWIQLPHHVEKGIESFPKALSMLFSGGHIGRLLVDINGSLSTSLNEA